MFLHAILMWPVAARWRVAPGGGAAGALERASPVAVARRRARAVCMAGRPCAALTQTILRATRKVKRKTQRNRTEPSVTHVYVYDRRDSTHCDP